MRIHDPLLYSIYEKSIIVRYESYLLYIRKEKKMSPFMLFTIMLIAGICFLVLGKKLDGKAKGIFITAGIVICIFSAYGLFTSFL